MMETYKYQDCLDNSYRVNWTIDEILNDKSFNIDKYWLPQKLSAATSLPMLDDDEKRKLTHIEMGAYAHIFGYVEEFIAPVMTYQSHDFEIDNRQAFDALANFVAEEVKHMNMFRRVREMVDQTIGFNLKLIEGASEVAHYVLSKNRGSALLLIDCIEWFTQYHYIAAIKEDDGLDALTKRIFKAHWLEESQHARIDHLEALRVFEIMDDQERDVAVIDLIELVQAVDGLLQQQAELDVQNFEKYIGRIFNREEREEIYSQELKKKRWVFIECGLCHPRFIELFTEVTTPEQQEKVQRSLAA